MFAARSGDVDAGLSMLKKLDSKTGYVYYIAVLPEYRGKKIGGRLLDSPLSYFFEHGVNVVFASLMQEHDEANFLFKSRGFSQTSFGEVAKKYGKLHAINMYRKMVVVTGEVVAFKELSAKLEGMKSELDSRWMANDGLCERIEDASHILEFLGVALHAEQYVEPRRVRTV